MISITKELRFWVPLLLIIAAVVTICLKVDKYKHERRSREVLAWDASQTNKLYAMYTFRLSPKGRESAWSNALSKKLNGKREKVITAGRVDVVTDDLAIEVEKIDKWHEGIGQALHYGLYTQKRPTLAIITFPPKNQYDKTMLDVIETVCQAYDIDLILLMPK